MLQPALVRCTCALLLTAATLAVPACSGNITGRARLGPVTGLEVDLRVTPHPGVVEICGTTVIDDRSYNVYCDGAGDPVFIEPVDEPGRRLPLQPDDGSDTPNTNAVPLSHDGQALLTVPLPDTLVPMITGEATDLLQLYDVAAFGDGSFELPFWYASHAGVADLRVALSSQTPLPDPFQFDLQYDTIVAGDADAPDAPDAPAFVMHHVIGPTGEVLAYANAAGLVAITPDVSFSDGDAGVALPPFVPPGTKVR